jgi:general secretion pathway protein C
VNEIAAKLALPARWLMVAGIAYTLATTVLYVLSPPTVDPGISIGNARSTATARPPLDLNAVLERNLFGSSGERPMEMEQFTTPTVATQLPLDLLGVFVADTTESSAAIISQRGRPGLLYTVGADVPGNAKLVEVHANHVVLRRAGTHETLHFPTGNAALAARRNVPEPLPEPIYTEPQMQEETYYEEPYQEPYEEPHQEPYQEPYQEEPAQMDEQAMPTPQQLMDQYRERLEEEPVAMLDELGMSAVGEGTAEGYRIGDLAHSPYLSHTGLQPGDVVLSVNGRPVGNIEQDRSEIQSVLAQGTARLEIQRGTRRFFVTASLQQ